MQEVLVQAVEVEEVQVFEDVQEPDIDSPCPCLCLPSERPWGDTASSWASSEEAAADTASADAGVHRQEVLAVVLDVHVCASIWKAVLIWSAEIWFLYSAMCCCPRKVWHWRRQADAVHGPEHVAAPEEHDGDRGNAPTRIHISNILGMSLS